MNVDRRRMMQSASSLALAPLLSANASATEPVVRPQRAWGYMDRHSVLPGEGFDVMLASRPGVGPIRGRLVLLRVGSEEDHAPAAWSSTLFDLKEQPVHPGAAATGPNWQPTLYGLNSTGLIPGVYLADFVEEGANAGEHLFHIVVRKEGTVGILLKLGTNTYQAYNAFGGHSFYTSVSNAGVGGTMVSFDRPLGRTNVLEYDIFLIRFLEDLVRERGISVGYTTDFDVHSNPSALLGASLVLCSAHDEYWSKEMFDAFEQRIHFDGRNTIFFGANTAYWQARYVDANRPPGDEDRGRQLVCCKWTHDPIARRAPPDKANLLITRMFRYESRRPETMLMGAAYQDWFPPYPEADHRYPYRVVTVDGPLFQGTGWSPGQVAADVVGYEWDNRDPQGDGKRLWDAERSRNAAIPTEDIKVLFIGHPVGQAGPGLAEAVTYRSRAGAKVFDASSIRWVWGLGKPGYSNPAFRGFNTNLLLDFLA
jgi:hypothetical protein